MKNKKRNKNVLKTGLLFVLVTALVFSFNCTVFAGDETVYVNDNPVSMEGKTVILHTNDIHGSIGGYAYVSALVKKYESLGAEVILADAGDYSQGSIYVSESEGESAIELMNAVGYDVATVGNHEFDYGCTKLVENLKKADFKVISTGINDESGKPVFDPSFTYTTSSGMKISFVGITTPETSTSANPKNTRNLSFLSDENFGYFQKEVNLLSDSDLIIGLSHLGVDVFSKPFRSYELWQKTKGLDFIIDGHSHTVMTAGEQGEPIQSTGTECKNAGIIVIDNATKKIESHGLIPINENSAKDETVAAKAKEITDRVDSVFNKKFAVSEVFLNGEKSPNGNRDSETNTGDLVADALVWQVVQIINENDNIGFDVDHVVGIMNGGSIRAGINPGDVTGRDVLNVLPFFNTVAVVCVKGETLLNVLEASTYLTPGPLGGFPQVSGMKFTLNTTKSYDAKPESYPKSNFCGPASVNRVTITEVNGKPFNPDDIYAVVTNDFCASGGDTYYELSDSKMKIDSGIILCETVIRYIDVELNGVIGKEYEKPQGRISIVDETVAVSDENKGSSTEKITEPVSVNNNGSVAENNSEINTYTVTAGDCLWSLAVRYYGKGALYTRIAAENGIINPRLIHVGDVLRIPAA